MPRTIQFKLLSATARSPFKKYSTDAGFDLYSDINMAINPGHTMKLDCGIALNIPPGFYGFIVPRSSWRQKGLACMSVYDAGFQGRVEPFVTNMSNSILYIQQDERIVQLIIREVPDIELVEVELFVESERGELGAGSTGRF